MKIKPDTLLRVTRGPKADADRKYELFAICPAKHLAELFHNRNAPLTAERVKREIESGSAVSLAFLGEWTYGVTPMHGWR